VRGPWASRARGSRTRRSVAVALGAAWMAVPTVAGAQTPGQVGAPERAGDVAVVEVTDLSRALLEGGSATEFTLRLPSGASCPGDSANDQWRVQSFVVPAADDPGTLYYGSQGPDGVGRYALYLVSTRPYVHMLTQQNDRAGQPGRISVPPPLSFGVFPPGTLQPGRYRIGIACTYLRKTAVYWDAEIDLAAAPGDAPAQLTWRVVDEPDLSRMTGSEESQRRTAFIVGGVLAAVAATLMAWQRHARSRTLASKEPS